MLARVRSGFTCGLPSKLFAIRFPNAGSGKITLTATALVSEVYVPFGVAQVKEINPKTKRVAGARWLLESCNRRAAWAIYSDERPGCESPVTS